MSSSSVTRIGMIGAGELARTRAKCLAEIPEAELCAVASRTREKAQRFAQEHGINVVFANHHELLASEVDAVIVATPNDTHYEIVTDALKADKDVLVEYPMVLYSEQASEIVRLSRERRVVVEVGFDSRFDPLDRKLREVVQGGNIGEPLWCSAQLLYHVNFDPGRWYWQQEATRGMVVSWMVERFDLLLRLCGEAEHVFALQAPEVCAGAGVSQQHTCVVNLQFQRGAVGVVSLCCLAPPGFPASVVEVIGRKGGGWCDGRTLRLFTDSGEERTEVAAGHDSFAEETAYFVQCVRERRPTENPPANSLAALCVAEAAIESLR